MFIPNVEAYLFHIHVILSNYQVTILVQYWNTIPVYIFYTSIVDNTGIPVLWSPKSIDPIY